MGHRTAFRARTLIVGVLVLAAVGVAPGAARAATLRVVPIGHGSVSFTPAPQSGGSCTTTTAVGQTTDLKSGSCEDMSYAPGTVVRLEAIDGVAGDPDPEDPATTFLRWSDDRCSPGNARVCRITVGSEPLTVAALFSPQRVSVRLEGNVATDEVTIGLAGTLVPSPCVVTPGAPTDCHADFDPDRSGPVTFSVQQGAQPVWLETPADGTGRKLCDTPPVTTCTVTPLWPRWGSIGFDGVPPNDQPPPDVSVNFRVAKAGNGSGTIRSDSLNCGSDCSTEGRFGENETLTAVPDDGSRFDGWRAACGSAPTCRLAIGPVTSLTAVFQKSGAAGGGSKPGTKPPGRRAFTARVLGVTVRGHGRRRMISIRLRVSAQATVLARLVRGRRPVASHRWRVRPGTRVLRMRVPARARPGAYRVRLTIGGGGDRVGITRGVRLRR